MTSLVIDSFSISLDNSLLTVAFTTDIDTETFPLQLYISSNDGATYGLPVEGIKISPYQFSNIYPVGTKLEVYLYDNTGSTIESNHVKRTVPIRFNSMEFITGGGSNVLDSYYTYGGQVNRLTFYYSQDNGATYSNTIPNSITISPYSINSNSYPGIFVAGTVYAYFFDSTANVSSPVSTATFSPPLPALLSLTSLAFETSGGSNVLDIQYTASNISSAISFYYSQDNGATFNEVLGDPNIYPSPYYLNSNTYPTLFSNEVLFTGYLFNKLSNVSSGFISTIYYKPILDLKAYYYTITGGSNVLNVFHDKQNISSPTYLYYSYDVGVSYNQLTSPISSLSTYLLSNAYPSLFLTGQTSYGFIRDDIGWVSTGVLSATFSPPLPALLSLTSLAFETSGGSNVLDIQYTASNISSAISFYYSQDNGATFNVLAGDPNIYPSPYYLNSNTYPTLFSNGTVFTGYLFNSSSNVSSGFISTIYYKPILDLKAYFYTTTGGSNVLNVFHNKQNISSPTYLYYSYDVGVSYTQLTSPVSSLSTYLLSNAYPALFSTGKTTYGFIRDDIDWVSTVVSSAIFFAQAVSFDKLYYQQFQTSNTLNIYYSTTQILNPLHLYYSQDEGATYTTLAGDPDIISSPFILTSNTYPTLFSNGSNISAYLKDTIDNVSSAVSTTTFTVVPTIYFNSMGFTTSFGSNFLDSYYTYPDQVNSLKFYYSQNGGVSYNYTNDSINTSPYSINSNNYPGLFVNGTVYGYFYDETADISSAVSTATFVGPVIPFAICTITYGYDTMQNTDKLTATFYDQYDQMPHYTTYKWLINGTLAITASIQGIYPIILYSNTSPSYFTRGVTFCNTISNPNCNNVTNNYIDFTNPNFTITNAYSTNTNTFYANLNYTYPFSNSNFGWSFTTSTSNFTFYYSTTNTIYPLSTILSNAYFTPGQTFSNLVTDSYGRATSQLTFVYPKFTIDSVSQTIAPSSVNLSYSYIGFPTTDYYSIQADTVGGTLYSKNNIASNINPIGFDQLTYPDLFTNGRSTFFTMYNTTTPEAGSLSTLPFLYVYPLSLDFQISSITLDPTFSLMNVFFLDLRNQASVYYKLYINGNYTNVFNTSSNIRQLTLSNSSILTNPFFAPGCNQNYIFDSTNQVSTQIFNFSVPSFYFQLSNVSLTNNLANLSIITTYYQNNNGAGIYPSSFQLYVNSTFTQSISTTTTAPNNFLITKDFNTQNLFIAGSTSIYQVNAITTTELLQSTNAILFTTPSSIFISSIQLTPDNTRIVTYFETNFSSLTYFEKFNSQIYASTISSPMILSSINAPSLFQQYLPLATQIINSTQEVISPTSNYILTAEISTFSIASLFFDTYYSSLTVSWIYALKNSNIGLTNLKYGWYMRSNTTITPLESNITGTSRAQVEKNQVINPITMATPLDFFLGGANWSTYMTAYSDASLAAGYSNNTPEVGQLVSSYFYINTITLPDNNTMNFNFVYNITDYLAFTLYINDTETVSRATYPGPLSLLKSAMPPDISYPQFFTQGFNGNARIFNINRAGGSSENTPNVNYYYIQELDDTTLVLPSTNASEITFINAEFSRPSKLIMLPPTDCNAGKVLHFKYYNLQTTATRVTIIPNIPGLTTTTPAYVTFSTPYTSMIDGSANSLVNFGVTAYNSMQSNAALSLLCDGVNWYTINQYKGGLIRESGNTFPPATAYEPYGNQVSFYNMIDPDKTSIQLAEFGDCFLKFLVVRNSTGLDKDLRIYTPSTSISTFSAEGYQNYQNFYQLPNSNQIKVNETYSFMFSYIPSTNYQSIFCLGYANLTSTLQASTDYSLTAKSMASTICMSSNFSTFQTISSVKASNFGNLYIYKNTNVSTSSFFIQTPTSNSSFFLLGSTNYTVNTIKNTNPRDRQSAFWMFTTYSTNTLHTINIPVMYYAYNPIINESGGGGSNSN